MTQRPRMGVGVHQGDGIPRDHRAESVVPNAGSCEDISRLQREFGVADEDISWDSDTSSRSSKRGGRAPNHRLLSRIRPRHVPGRHSATVCADQRRSGG